MANTIFPDNAPANSGSSDSMLRTLLNKVASTQSALPAVAVRGATIRQATYSTTGTRAWDVIQAIGSLYPASTPYETGTVTQAGSGTQQSWTISAKSGTTGLSAIPVFGCYLKIVASNQVSLGGLTFQIQWANANFEAMNNTITIDPAFPDVGGTKTVEVWAFPAISSLGRYVYCPAALRAGVNTATPVVVTAAQQLIVQDQAAGYFPSSSQVFATALTRGQREVDDVFSSFSATAQRTAAVIRSA